MTPSTPVAPAAKGNGKVASVEKASAFLRRGFKELTAAALPNTKAPASPQPSPSHQPSSSAPYSADEMVQLTRKLTRRLKVLDKQLREVDGARTAALAREMVLVRLVRELIPEALACEVDQIFGEHASEGHTAPPLMAVEALSQTLLRQVALPHNVVPSSSGESDAVSADAAEADDDPTTAEWEECLEDARVQLRRAREEAAESERRRTLAESRADEFATKLRAANEAMRAAKRQATVAEDRVAAAEQSSVGERKARAALELVKVYKCGRIWQTILHV